MRILFFTLILNFTPPVGAIDQAPAEKQTANSQTLLDELREKVRKQQADANAQTQRRQEISGADLERFFESVKHNFLFETISRLLHKPGFLDKVARILNHPYKKYFFSAEVILILIFFIFQEWFLTRFTRMWERVFLRTVSLPFFLLVSLFLIPWMVFGKDFSEMFLDIYDVIKGLI